MGVLIKNGTLVSASRSVRGDLLCRDGRIEAIGSDLEAGRDDDFVDASGQLVMPGGLDPHVHLELAVMGTRSSDDFESGTAAAIAGGTTSIIDFVTPDRGQDYAEALRARHEEAAKACADYAFHQCITWWDEDTPEFMRRCVEEEGITSFKTFMAYLDTVGIDDVELLRVMRRAGELGGVVLVHAENGDEITRLQQELIAEGHTGPRYHALSRPPELEGQATARAVELASEAGNQLYVVHVSCRESQSAVEGANSARVFGEACTQHLLLDDRAYDTDDFEGAAYVMSPPLRSLGHQEVLWDALGRGALHTVATDHCPFDLIGQKDAGRDDFRRIPNGAAGIEHRLSLLHTHGVLKGRFDLQRFVELSSTRAARIFGLYPRKGSLEIGADADLVVFDPEATATISARTHRHRVDRSIYEGFGVQGLPTTVVANGRIQYHDGDLRVKRGTGRFLKRSVR